MSGNSNVRSIFQPLSGGRQTLKPNFGAYIQASGIDQETNPDLFMVLARRYALENQTGLSPRDAFEAYENAVSCTRMEIRFLNVMARDINNLDHCPDYVAAVALGWSYHREMVGYLSGQSRGNQALEHYTAVNAFFCTTEPVQDDFDKMREPEKFAVVFHLWMECYKYARILRALSDALQSPYTAFLPTPASIDEGHDELRRFGSIDYGYCNIGRMLNDTQDLLRIAERHVVQRAEELCHLVTPPLTPCK